jgi:hypothetical protein
LAPTGATWENGGGDIVGTGVDGAGAADGRALAAAGSAFLDALSVDVLQDVTETAMTRAAIAGRRRWRGGSPD